MTSKKEAIAIQFIAELRKDLEHREKSLQKEGEELNFWEFMTLKGAVRILEDNKSPDNKGK